MNKEKLQDFLNERYTGRLFQWRNQTSLIIKFKVSREDLIYVDCLFGEQIKTKRWQYGHIALVKWINDKQKIFQEKANSTKEVGQKNS